MLSIVMSSVLPEQRLLAQHVTERVNEMLSAERPSNCSMQALQTTVKLLSSIHGKVAEIVLQLCYMSFCKTTFSKQTPIQQWMHVADQEAQLEAQYVHQLGPRCHVLIYHLDEFHHKVVLFARVVLKMSTCSRCIPP